MNHSKRHSELDSIYITLTGPLSGAKPTSQVLSVVSSPGGMSASAGFMAPTTCPVCLASLELLVGPSPRSGSSKPPGSPPIQESETGTDEWSLTFNEPDKYEIRSATTSLTLTDRQIAFLRLWLGYHNQPSPLYVLVGLLDYVKHSPGVRFSSRSTIALCFNSHFIESIPALFRQLETILKSLHHIETLLSSLGGSSVA
jgi:hypothetical protein